MVLQAGNYKIENCENGQVMAVDRGSTDADTRIITWGWLDSDEQKFRLTPMGNELYRLVPKNTLYKNMAVSIGGGSKDESAPIVQAPWHNGVDQRWALHPGPGDNYFLLSPHSGRVMAMVGGGPNLVRQGHPVKDAKNQLWRLTCVEPVVPTGTIPWAVQLHGGDSMRWKNGKPHDGPFLRQQSLDNAKKAFRFIRQLGATYLRASYEWGFVEPNQGDVKEQILDYFKEYTELALHEGFQDGDKKNVIGVLHGPPEWSWSLNDTDLVAAFKAQCHRVASSLKDLVPQFQIWNEPNNYVQESLGRTVGHRSNEFWARILGEGNKALQKELGDTYERGWVNMHCFSKDWKQTLEDYFNVLNRDYKGHRINIGIDQYPGTWANNGAPSRFALAADNRWLGLFTLEGAARAAGEFAGAAAFSLGRSVWTDWSPIDTVAEMVQNRDNPCFRRKIAIMETGFTTPPDAFPYLFPNHSEGTQRDWIYGQPASALSELYVKIHDWRRRHPQRDLVSFCTWYTLYDGKTGSTKVDKVLGAEDNFGIMHSDHQTPKEGFQFLAHAIDGFTNGTLVV